VWLPCSEVSPSPNPEAYPLLKSRYLSLTYPDFMTDRTTGYLSYLAASGCLPGALKIVNIYSLSLKLRYVCVDGI
jgi:hypothetical protein